MTAIIQASSVIWSLTCCTAAAVVAHSMPRIRERKQQQQAISVTPWMNKKGSTEGAASRTSDPEERKTLMYSVVLADAQLSASGLGPCDNITALVTAAEPSPCSPDTVTTSPGNEEWRSVRRQQPHPGRLHSLAVGSTPASQAAQGDNEDPSAVFKDTGQQRPQFLDVDQGPQPQQQQQQPSLHGFAELILLPSGTIAGRFMAQNSITGTQQQHHLVPLPVPFCLGLHGKQVLGIHSCYRDPEWALLQMSIIRCNSSSDRSSGRGPSKGADSSSRPSSSSRSREGAEATLDGVADGAALPCAGFSHALQADDSEASRIQQQEDHQPLKQQQQQQPHAKRLRVERNEQSAANRRCVDQHLVNQSQQVQTVSSNHSHAAAVAAPAAAAAGGAAVGLGLIETIDVTSGDVTPDSTDVSSEPTAAAAAFDAIDDASNSSIAAEAVAWVQRTGGDLVTLSPADLDDEDTLTVILQENLGLDSDFAHIDFKAKTLLAGATADDKLRINWPQLVGQEGIVVNFGSMTVSNLPHNWLG